MSRQYSKTIISAGGEDWDYEKLMESRGLSRAAAKHRVYMYRDGDMTEKQFLAPKRYKKPHPTFHVNEPVKEDRSPGWWERQNLNPTTFSKSGNFQECAGYVSLRG